MNDSVDDSLHYLRAFDVDFIKIDGAFVHAAMNGQARDRRLLAHVVAYCRDAGVKTIAEKIEHESQLEHLRALGITHAQGYLFGKPVAA